MHYIALSDLFVMQSLSTQDQRMLSCDYRWSQFKSGASRRNISVDIDKRQYTQLICSPCHYCARAPAAAFRIGIDRIDSSKAYTSSNCVSCCNSCNFMKNTMSYDDYLSQALLRPNTRAEELLRVVSWVQYPGGVG